MIEPSYKYLFMKFFYLCIKDNSPLALLSKHPHETTGRDLIASAFCTNSNSLKSFELNYNVSGYEKY